MATSSYGTRICLHSPRVHIERSIGSAGCSSSKHNRSASAVHKADQSAPLKSSRKQLHNSTLNAAGGVNANPSFYHSFHSGSKRHSKGGGLGSLQISPKIKLQCSSNRTTSDMAANRESGAIKSAADMQSDLEEVAKQVAMEAGRLIVAASGKVENVETKGVRSDLVTEVDKACEDLIKRRIQESFPDHAILGEETSTNEELGRVDSALAESDWTWIVDPIDGTLNFVAGLPLSVVSIGIAKGNKVEVGVVYNPYSGELFTARRGQGAFLNGEAISVLPPDTELEDGAVSVGFPSKRAVRERMLRGVSAVAPHARTVRALGTAALHMSYVAAGKLACFFELNLKPWDIAAAWLIVEEAGGHVTDMAGKPMRLRAGPIVASCGGQIHDRILSLLREAECTGEETDLQ